MYHINGKGIVELCGATVKACPFGAGNHFSSKEEAQAFADTVNAGGLSTIPTTFAKNADLKKIEAEKLIDELHVASQKYYQELEASDLSDEEYDDKLEYLKHFQKDYPELFAKDSKGYALVHKVASGTATQVKADKLVKHEIPMLSLLKAKTDEEVRSYLKKVRAAGAENFVLQAKLDGLAVSVEYENGQAKQLSTRGNGKAGEDLTYLLRSSEVTIEGLPTSISNDGRVEVRGEMFLTNDQFQNATKAREAAHDTTPFKNSRNGAVGIVKKAQKGLGYQATLTFCTYSIIENSKPSSKDIISNDGFITVDEMTASESNNMKLDGFANDNEILQSIAKFGRLRDDFQIPTDGIVIKPSNEAEMQSKMGNGTSHPLSQLAFKYTTPHVETKILSIETTVGKTGKLTLVANLEPVDILGSTVQRVTLNNYNWAHDKNVRVGSTVSLTKANEIIPFIRTVLSNPEDATPISIPTQCPQCQSKLWYDKTKNEYPPQTLLCKNRECPSRKAYGLKTAVGRNILDIDGLSVATLNALQESGTVTDLSDLYQLTEDQLAETIVGYTEQGNPRRFGLTRSKHVLKYLEASKNHSLGRHLQAINIPGLGNTSSKALEKKFKNIDALLEATADDIAEIDGMGEKTANEIVEGLQYNRPLIERLRRQGLFAVSTENDSSKIDLSASKVAGLSFAISGPVPNPFANRNAWVDYIEKNGGSFHSSPKATTSFMVGDPNDTSSKNKKAVQLGLTFISAEDFTSQFV